MDPYNPPKTLPLTPQSPLQSASKSLLTDAGAPQARPAGWFIAAGQDKNFKNPNIQPDSQGGKWICTKLKEKGVIDRELYIRLSRAHALAILRHPNFCFWYLKNAEELVKQMTLGGFSWKIGGSQFIERLLTVHKELGFEAAFQFYKRFCVQNIALYAWDRVSFPDQTRFGAIKFLFHKWFWMSAKNLFKWERV